MFSNGDSKGGHERSESDSQTDSSDVETVSTEESVLEERPHNTSVRQHGVDEELHTEEGTSTSSGGSSDSSDSTSSPGSGDIDKSSPKQTTADKAVGNDVPEDSINSIPSEYEPKAKIVDKGKSREMDDESSSPHMCHSCGRYVYLDGVEGAFFHIC